MSVRKGILLLALLCHLPVWAALDLIGRTPTNIEMTKAGEIRFQLQVVNNSSDTAAQGVLRIKPFLLPTLEGANAAVVLLPQDYKINLVPQATMSVTYQMKLPAVQKGRYLLATVVNSNNSLFESDHLNNTTDLAETPELFMSEATLNDSPIDLYSEIVGDISPRRGGAGHQLRTILKGTERLLPSRQYPDEAIWARFMLADLQKKKIYTLNYGTGRGGSSLSEVEKNWYALAWAAQKDKDNNPILVDFYSQSPSYQHVPPGRYQFLTLMNSRDLIVEKDPSDNLDMEPFTLTPFAPLVSSEIWMVANIQKSFVNNPLASRFNPNYAGDMTYEAEIVSPVDQVTLTNPRGVISGRNPTLDLGLQVTGENWLEGTYWADVHVRTTPFFGALHIPVRLFVHGERFPVQEFSASQMQFQTPQALTPEPQVLTLHNSGGEKLIWRAEKKAEWIQLSKTSGVIAPGESAEIWVGVDPKGFSPSNSAYSANILFSTNAVGTGLEIPVKMQIDRR